MVVVQYQDQRAINYQFGAATGLNQAFPFVLVLDTTLLGIVTLMKFIFLFFPVDFVQIRLAQASHTWLGNMNRKCEKKINQAVKVGLSANNIHFKKGSDPVDYASSR